MVSRARSVSTLVIGLACSPLACASGEFDGGNNTFTTTLTTNNANDTDDDDEGETRDDSGGTDHADESDETGDPPPEPSCDDSEQNQGETDLDCGGPNCDPCGDGQACVLDSDCQTLSCVAGLCIVPSCTDGVKNGDETDVDCGGGCSPCGSNQGCSTAGDCQSGVCAGSFCAAPNCGDAVQNGSETDVDCGGTCSGCVEGQGCAGNGDCLSQFCQAGACAPADCLIDADCASFNSQCTTGVCNAQKTCDAVAINNGNSCNDGDNCTTSEVCSAGTCGGGSPVDCSGLSNACNLGVCNPDNGSCIAQPTNNGNPCNDNNTCTVGEVCSAGMCADPNAPGYLFYDDFNDNAAGWGIGTEWGIGAATASLCANICPGDDPATDHTATADNGVAGAMIGGCVTTSLHGDYCLTSPPINTANLATVWLTYWRHLHADYSPFMNSSVQVYNGVSWTSVWTTGGSCTNDGVWTQMAHNLTSYKAVNMQVRFCHSVGDSFVYSSGGWNIDDVVIGPAQCTP